jgi:peptide/nickel transport system ATP-binding protein
LSLGAPTPILEITDLVVEARRPSGAVRLLDGIGLSLYPGRILGVVGESGAGKSLTGAAIIGLLDPPLRQVSGTLKLRGAVIGRGTALRRGRDVGMIFQDPLTALNPVFTIGHQLVETLRTHHDFSAAAARERAIQLLTEVGISAPHDRMRQYPHQLSGGMRQRVVIALALAPDPLVLIADEPTTALDVSVQAQIVGLIRFLCDERGMAVLFITHDMGVIAEAADDVAVLYAGRVVETGPVADILTAPTHPYTRALLASTLEIGQRRDSLPQIEGAAPGAGTWPIGCAFSPRCPDCTQRCRELPPTLLAWRASQVACWNHPAHA